MQFHQAPCSTAVDLMNSLAAFQYKQTESIPVMAPKNKKDNTMCYECGDNGKFDADEHRIDYLNSRANEIFYATDRQLNKDFYLVDDSTPTTPKEMVTRIESGKYEIIKGYEDKEAYDPIRFIRWRDPSKKADKEGYDKAMVKMTAKYTETKDAIAILPATEALDAVKAFEKAKFH